MAKDAPPDAPVPELSRLDALRAAVAKLPAVTVKRVDAVPDSDKISGSKAYVLASWGNKRVAHVVEPPFSLDDAEIAVLSVVLANHAVS